MERVDKTDKSFQFFFGAGCGSKTIIYVAAKKFWLGLGLGWVWVWGVGGLVEGLGLRGLGVRVLGLGFRG